jgi:hypothetical protein
MRAFNAQALKHHVTLSDSQLVGPEMHGLLRSVHAELNLRRLSRREKLALGAISLCALSFGSPFNTTEHLSATKSIRFHY